MLLQYAKKRRAFTYAALQADLFRDKHPNAIKSTVRRALKKGLLQSHRLPENVRLYQLTEKGCKAVGAPRELARRFGPQARYDYFALNWYCAEFPAQQPTLFNPAKHEQFSIPHEKVRRHFYLLEKNEDRVEIGPVFIDHGTKPYRLVEKVASRLQTYFDNSWFIDEIRSGLFFFTVLTVSDEKRDRIRARLQMRISETLAKNLPCAGSPIRLPKIRLEVHTVTGLARLLPQ